MRVDLYGDVAGGQDVGLGELVVEEEGHLEGAGFAGGEFGAGGDGVDAEHVDGAVGGVEGY